MAPLYARIVTPSKGELVETGIIAWLARQPGDVAGSARLLGAVMGEMLRLAKRLAGVETHDAESNKRITALETHIAALEARVVGLEQEKKKGVGLARWAGVHESGRRYQQGELTTRSGNIWIATRDTDETPGFAPEHWTLIQRAPRR